MMKADFRSEAFTHGKCMKCSHISTIDKFDMIETPLDNVVQTKLSEKWDLGEMKLSTYTGTCPLCGCEFVEFLYGSEVN